MARKITTEVWLSERTDEQRSKFDYSKVVYVGSHKKITLICKKCNTEFQQSAGSHAQGRGCKVCAQADGGKTQKLTQSQFLEHCKEVHGDRYDYSRVNYKNSLTKVDIICKREGHGVFSIMPPGHTHAGGGCPVCAQEVRTAKMTKTQEKFLEQCKAQNAPKITFENVRYVSDKAKVSFTCTDHGPFDMSPTNFLQGQRCPSCSESGYRASKPGTLYILAAGNITKVGITNRPIRDRVKEISKSSGKKFVEIFHTYSVDGKFISELEDSCLNYFRSKYKSVEEKFDGSTECFLNVSKWDAFMFLLPRSEAPVKFA